MTEKNDFQMQRTNEEEHNNNALKEQQTSEEKVRKIVAMYMRNLGMPCHIRGYHYVIDAISWCVFTPEIINMVTKGLYPEIAKKHKTTSSRVERAIRHAIEVAWSRGDLDTMDRVFGNIVDAQKGKPTNSEFIAQIAEDIRINNQF